MVPKKYKFGQNCARFVYLKYSAHLAPISSHLSELVPIFSPSISKNDTVQNSSVMVLEFTSLIGPHWCPFSPQLSPIGL